MTDEIFQEVLDGILEGTPIQKTLEFYGVKPGAFFHYRNKDPSRIEAHARAKSDYADMGMGKMREVAETCEDAARARNIIDVLKFQVSRWNPKEYGDRIDINVTKTVDINAALEAGMKRALPVSDLESIEDAQVIETKAITDNSLTDSVPVNPKDHDLKGRK